MNNIAHLIRLTNRIADFFEAMPDRDEALDGIAGHIRKFWEPRMRKALLDHLDQHPEGEADGVQMHPIALEAIIRNKEALRPRAPA